MILRFLLVLLAVCGMAVPSHADTPIDLSPQAFFGGPANLRLVRDAASVTVYRITEKKFGKKTVTIDDRICDPKPVVVSGAAVARAAAALVEVKNHHSAFMCDFSPGVVIRFADAEKAHTLDLVVCFSCGELVMYSDGKAVEREAKWASRKSSFRKNIHNPLARIARTAFPKDAEIQKVKVYE